MLTKKDLTSIEEILDKKFEVFTKKEIDPMKKDLTKIKNNTKYIVDYFDKEYLEVRSRVKKLERGSNSPIVAN